MIIYHENPACLSGTLKIAYLKARLPDWREWKAYPSEKQNNFPYFGAHK